MLRVRLLRWAEFFAGIFERFKKKKEVVEGVVKESLPAFFLPETLQEFERQRAEILAKAAQLTVTKKAEMSQLDLQLNMLHVAQETGGASSARLELLKRDVRRVEGRRNALLSEINLISPNAHGDILRTRDRLGQEEGVRIATGGMVIHSSVAEVGSVRRERRERRVVRIEDGRVFLCTLRSHEILSKDESTLCLGSVRFGEPVVEWITDSVAQFNEDELKAVVAGE